MKKIILSLSVAVLGCMSFTSCIEEINPQSNTVTKDQAANAPGSFDKFVDAITSNLAGQFNYWPEKQFPYDFGYSSFFLARDIMGNDISLTNSGSYYQTWYTCGTALGPQYAVCQFPWSDYYGWINNCNNVISMAGAEPADNHKAGVGIAYAMRAMFYMDLARMFAQKTYALDKEAITVPIVDGDESRDLTHNPRATNEEMWNFIISDLDKAEGFIADYKRDTKYSPDLSVVYGLKARAYLTMEDWANAEKYAKMAQQGYTVLNEAEFTDRMTGFNTPNDSWMLAIRFQATDPCVTENDGDSSWPSIMCYEISPEVGCGYAANYGSQLVVDRHLYETIPATDFRKKVFVDFNIDDMETTAEKEEALSAYSDHPDWLLASASGSETQTVGGFCLKFRLGGGEEGRTVKYKGLTVSVPLMRVEEMKLIEAEAAGMQQESRGIELLTAFAKTRDPQYEYGKHNEAYGNPSTSAFQNEVWWQRRVELWGEGFATFDIKRLNKGIIRSYAGTNHLEGYRWNTTTPPDWMNFCIIAIEADYNYSLVNNPTPMAPESDSPEYAW